MIPAGVDVEMLRDLNGSADSMPNCSLWALAVVFLEKVSVLNGA
jgi:hypothetical protein